MSIRRIFCLLVLAIFLAPATASAGSWHRFSSKSLGFTVQYPSGWHVVQSPQLKQVSLQSQGRPVYSMMVSVLQVKPAHSLLQTLQRVRTIEHQAGNSQFGSIHWTASSIGGRAAEAGVLVPPTEGGAAVSNGIYVVVSRSHVYEITVVAFGKPVARQLGQFPAIYRTILNSWKFV